MIAYSLKLAPFSHLVWYDRVCLALDLVWQGLQASPANPAILDPMRAPQARGVRISHKTSLLLIGLDTLEEIC